MARATASNRVRADKWYPSDLPGVEGFCRVSTIKKQADGLTDITDGDQVIRLLDESHRRGHFLQAIAGQRPLYDAVSNNDLPAITFDGSNDNMVSEKPFSGAITGLWGVFNFTGGASFSGSTGLLSHNTTSPPQISLAGQGSTTNLFNYGGDSFVDGVNVGAGTVELTTLSGWHYVIIQDSSPGAWASGAILGRQGDNGIFWTGGMQEVGKLTTTLSALNAASLNAYLSETYGL